MLFYHNGAIVKPSAVRANKAFIGRAIIQTPDGHVESLVNLGVFANGQAAVQYSIRCALAFLDKQPMPRPPLVSAERTEDIARLSQPGALPRHP